MVGFADRVVDDQALHAMRKRLIDVCNSLDLTLIEYRVLVARGVYGVPLVELVRGGWLIPTVPIYPEAEDAPTLLEAKRAWRRALSKLVARPDLASFADLLNHGGYSLRYRDLGSDVGMLAQTIHTAAGPQIADATRERRSFSLLIDRIVVEECPLHGRCEVRPDSRRCPECSCMIPYPMSDNHPGRPRLFCSSQCRQRAYRHRRNAQLKTRPFQDC